MITDTAERRARTWARLKGVEVIERWPPIWAYVGEHGFEHTVPDPATAEGMVAWMEALKTDGYSVFFWFDDVVVISKGRTAAQRGTAPTLLAAFAAAVDKLGEG